ncbi:uncharacterized protein TRUGW13939_02967 [Talaromyces rugulosus]|uniref:Uncharacterized protein n=1 Tax=Talaromyces rugulosus TaxID=121627 RepID=A0A7H8QPR7_TALRU|nr:uncharacterized protein TRUGW13939_02967 [Talaromyces rugulosus]QKX55868.1 hypothetical protein TRUGW13939_02967 [Talaromyces rugulosus]
MKEEREEKRSEREREESGAICTRQARRKDGGKKRAGKQQASRKERRSAGNAGQPHREQHRQGADRRRAPETAAVEVETEAETGARFVESETRAQLAQLGPTAALYNPFRPNQAGGRIGTSASSGQLVRAT